MDTKTCIACSLPQSIDEFYRHPQTADGRLNKCKTCCKDQANTRRQEKLKEIKEYDRNRPNQAKRLENNKKYRRTEAGKQSLRQSQKAWDQRNREKKRAHLKVKRAVEAGILVKPVLCEGCTKPEELEGHHEDYDKPLEVKWLCEACHKTIHKEQRELARFMQSYVMSDSMSPQANLPLYPGA